MYINEQYHDLPLLETKEYRFISRDGQLISKQEQILKEHLIDVYLNDHLTMKLVCLPQYLTELVLGRLLTERIIDSISDIEQIYICEYGKRAKVYLNRTSKTLPQNIENNLFIEITPTCCTGNHILNDYFVSGQTPKTVPSINWKPDWIFQMPLLMACRFTAQLSPLTAVCLQETVRFYFPVKISAGIMHLIKRSVMHLEIKLIYANASFIQAAESQPTWQ